MVVRSKARVEAAVCSEARDEAAACSGVRIEDDRRWYNQRWVAAA
jgi:hypothetical protein